LNQADPRAWFLLGVCHHVSNELAEAAGAFVRSIALDPANAEAHIAYLSVLRSAGNPERALAAAREALRRLPDDTRILYATALCLEDCGQLNEALAQYDTALQLSPTFDDARYNKGLLLSRLGRLSDAERMHRHSIAADPNSSRAHSALADVLLAQGEHEDALKALDRLSALAPKDLTVQVRRGLVLALSKRFHESHEALASARSLDAAVFDQYVRHIAHGGDPDVVLSPESIFVCRRWLEFERCEWAAWDDVTAVMQEVATDPAIAVEPAAAFMCRLLPLGGSQRHAVVHKISSRIDLRYPPLPTPKPPARPRIRIGILSPDFRDHLNAYLLFPAFDLLDRTHFELFAYSLTSDDGSPVRDGIRRLADEFRDLQDIDDVRSAKLIREDDIDILVDVAGLTTASRYAITAQRPARLQVNYLGFSCSLASTRVDYAITDRNCGSAIGEWTEALAYLPDTHFLYDFRLPAPTERVKRSDYGLPEHAFVFCAFHRADKITPDVFKLWMRILAQATESVMWFRGLPEPAMQNLRAQATRQEIDPNRLVFAPFESSQNPRYLARHRLGDLMLDSLHHNAMTSACDALGMGLPMLTLPGNAMAARAGASLVRAAGLPELVADNEDDYVDKAIRLATKPSTVKALKARLQAGRRTAPLFDTVGRVRALEAAFQQMYDRMMRGERPTSFDVKV